MKIILDCLCRRGSCLKVCVQMRNQLEAGVATLALQLLDGRSSTLVLVA